MTALDIDFSNVQFTHFTNDDFDKMAEELSQMKTTQEAKKSKPKAKSSSFKTSYSILTDYIDQIENNRISKDLNDMINNYAMGNPSATLETLKQKLSLIKQQEEFKDAYIVYADTTQVKSSFKHPNIVMNNIIFLNSGIDFIVQNINKFNFTEHNYTNNSRLFFDVDYDPEKTIKKYAEKNQTITELDCFDELVKLFNLIIELKNKYALTPYGLIEYNSDKIDLNKLPLNELAEIQCFNNPNLTKALSSHIYLNGYTDRHSIMCYMKYLYASKGFKLDIFDTSVYKTTKQSLRMSYSPKVDIEKHTVRPLPQSLINYILQHTELISQLRMTPHPNDKQITIEDYKQNEDYKQLKPKIERVYLKPKSISLFQYIFKDPDGLINISIINSQSENHFEMVQKLNLLKALPLSADEFKNEFDNIEGIDEERKEHIFSKLQYHQDFKADSILYTHKKHIKDFNLIFNKIKNPTLEQLKVHSDIQQIKNKLSFYIDKYSKKCFINHTFYDIKTDSDYISFSKEMKILNNCCRFVSNGYIFYPYLNKTFTSVNQFKTYFGMNHSRAESIIESMTSFEDEQEFKVKSLKANIDNFNLKIEKKFNRLTGQQQSSLFDKVSILLSYLKQTFKDEEDYKFYLSYYHTKLNKMTTINKGLINQGTLTASAKDSLKTLFNDLLSDYIKIIKADIANINKSLNGGYFENELLVIEELPQMSKDDINSFVNKLKENTSVEKITIEKKGLNPYTIQNNNDIIINTNYTVKDLMYNKTNCETMLKRFKIMTRQSLNMSDAQLNYILDEFKLNKDKDLLKYCLYKYIKDNTAHLDYISEDYFNKNKLALNHIEQLYMDSATSTNTTERIETHLKLDEWINMFKANYLDKHNVLRLKAFNDYLISQKIFREMKTSTLKQLLCNLLLEDKSTEIKLNPKGSLLFTKAKTEDYAKIYNQFYSYVEIDEPTFNHILSDEVHF